jgi:hypothetical protein
MCTAQKKRIDENTRRGTLNIKHQWKCVSWTS